MAVKRHKGAIKAARTIAGKARARRSAYVMKPEYLAEIERFRLMDDDFMSKCLENAPECIELILQMFTMNLSDCGGSLKGPWLTGEDGPKKQEGDRP